MKAVALLTVWALAMLPVVGHPQSADGAMVTKAREIERRLGARVGLAIYDTASNSSWTYRAGERFPMTSTFKALACGALLHDVDRGRTALDRTVRIGQADLIPYAPVMERLVGHDVSLGATCAAALRTSDNVAGNKILESIGGPAGLTGFLRSIGDATTRLDRREPDLNEAMPGDARDTTTPAAIATTLRALVLGDALTSPSRQQLTEWLVADEVGGPLLRAGLPAGWQVADRTGAGGHGARGVIAVVWPPGRAPIVAAIYMADTDATMDERNHAIAELGRALAADVTR